MVALEIRGDGLHADGGLGREWVDRGPPGRSSSDRRSTSRNSQDTAPLETGVGPTLRVQPFECAQVLAGLLQQVPLGARAEQRRVVGTAFLLQTAPNRSDLLVSTAGLS